ncbi:MAG: MurR/RpiR family transcriptional regulator [Bacteroidetes bacterium]|nr:MurR/RpiR family transcriptional regulator [Bacteroidota bacterium]
MNRYKEIKGKIKRKYKLLPKNQKNVAHYILNNFDKIPFINVHELSVATHVSVASIVRFSQRTGYKGFSELRNEITKSLQKELYKKENIFQLGKKNIKQDILTEVANLDMKNINESLNLIDRNTFNYIINKISTSGKVYTVGLGISYLLAEILSYQLTQVGISSSVLNHSHAIFNEQILFIKPKDLLIVFSFPPFSKETIEAAEYAKKRKIEVFAITNNPASPVTFIAKSNLIIKSENMLYTNSFSAVSVLINTIATACAIKNKRLAKNFQKNAEEIMINQDLIMREG